MTIIQSSCNHINHNSQWHIILIISMDTSLRVTWIKRMKLLPCAIRSFKSSTSKNVPVSVAQLVQRSAIGIWTWKHEAHIQLHRLDSMCHWSRCWRRKTSSRWITARCRFWSIQIPAIRSLITHSIQCGSNKYFHLIWVNWIHMLRQTPHPACFKRRCFLPMSDWVTLQLLHPPLYSDGLPMRVHLFSSICIATNWPSSVYDRSKGPLLFIQFMQYSNNKTNDLSTWANIAMHAGESRRKVVEHTRSMYYLNVLTQ